MDGTLNEDVIVNADGSYSVAGNTECYDLPTTSNAYLASVSNQQNDTYGFMAKFSSDGSQLVNSTLFPEPVFLMVQDGQGNTWISGSGDQNTPATDGSVQPFVSGGGYVAELNTTLSKLLYCTYLKGGIGHEAATGDTFFVPIGMVFKGVTLYIGGYDTDAPEQKYSNGYFTPMSPSPGAVFTAGNCFLEALDTSTDAITNVTLLPINFQSLALTPDGNLAVTGPAPSGLPTTHGAYHSVADPQGSNYIAVISPNLTTLVAATYFGGIATPTLNAYVGPESDLKIDAQGNIAICGWTYSDQYPTIGTLLAPVPAKINGLTIIFGNEGEGVKSAQCFLAKFSSNLTKLEFSTLLPGTYFLNNGDYAESHLLLDDAGNAFILGNNVDTSVSLTPGALLTDPSQLGNYSAHPNFAETSFLMGLSMEAGASITIDHPNSFGGIPAKGTITLQSPAPTGGLTVPLSLIPADKDITIPKSVTITTGQTQATFVIQTAAVALNEHETIGAKFDSGYQYATFNNLAPQVVSISASSPIVAVGGFINFTVNLSSPAPANFPLIFYDLPYQFVGASPFSFSQGVTSESFPLQAYDSVDAPTQTQIQIGGQLNYNYVPSVLVNGQPVFYPSFIQNMTITPNACPTAFALNKATASAGTQLTGTVKLDGPVGSSGVTVTLTSSSAAATVPPQVTLNPGMTSFTVPITTSNVTASTKVTLQASAGGYNASVSATVQPNTLSKLSAASTVLGLNASDNFTLSLLGPAPSGSAATVTLVKYERSDCAKHGYTLE